ncbi:MAG TPA: hypothetical protein VGD74_12640 [Vulgatibacter sp.]
MDTRIPLLRWSTAAVAATLVLVAGTSAQAAECASLPNPVYLAGSSASKPVLKQLAKILSAREPAITLVYQSTGSCAGVDAIVNSTPVTATAKYWDAEQKEVACDLPAEGATVDIGISDVYSESCDYVLGANQADFFGPIQVMTFVAPAAASESSISAAAAYVALGFGGENHVVPPWDNKDFFYIRADSSGTKAMIAKAIGLPVSKWIGNVQSGSGDVNTAVSSSVQPDKTIGILAADYADANRDKLKILAYEHGDQLCGYLPDSSSTSFDKINVRDGRYAIWGPLHFMANVDAAGRAIPGAGNPAGDAVATVARYVTHDGLSEQDGRAMIQAEAAAYTVPVCAMRVSRTSEVGPVSPFVPDEPCGCFFESLQGATTTECTACTSNADCSGATPTCRYGFCEAK